MWIIELGLGFTRFGGREEERGACSSSVRRRENGSHQREPSTELPLAIGGSRELQSQNPSREDWEEMKKKGFVWFSRFLCSEGLAQRALAFFESKWKCGSKVEVVVVWCFWAGLFRLGLFGLERVVEFVWRVEFPGRKSNFKLNRKKLYILVKKNCDLKTSKKKLHFEIISKRYVHFKNALF